MIKAKPLSSLLYVKSNTRKFLPQLLAAIFGVFLVYFLCIIGGGIYDSAQIHHVKTLEKLSVIYVNSSSRDSLNSYKKIIKNANIKKVIYVEAVHGIDTDGLISDTGSHAFFTGLKDTKYLMNLFKFKLEKGTLPHSSHDLLINTLFARSRKLGIGSYYGTDVNKSDDLTGKYRICGTYKGSHIITFGYGNSKNIYRHGYSSYLLIAKNSKLNHLNNILKKYKSLHPWDLDILYRDTKGFLYTITVFLIIILLITVFVITFAISNINYMHLCARVDEFSILNAIGYSKRKILCSLMKELSAVIFLGYIFGTSLGIFAGFIFQNSYCEPKGIVVNTISLTYLLITLVVPILVFLLSAIPIMKYIRNMNTMDILEGRI